MKILVTGAAGFIGTRLVKKLITKEDIEIFALVKKNVNIFKKKSLLKIIESDMSIQNLTELELEVDVIIHLAAVKQHYKKKEEIFKNNLEVTENLLKSFKNIKHFIFASTSIAEPRSVYSESKFQTENLIKKSNVNYTILRMGPVFGVEDNTNISKLIKLIEEEKSFPIPGSGNVEIQPIFVDDVINSILEIISNKKYSKKIVKIAGESIIFKNLIKQICSVLGKKNKSFHVPIIFLKIFVLIYEKISSKPLITRQQIENFKLGSEHNMESDFHVSKLENSLKKFHEEYLNIYRMKKNTIIDKSDNIRY
jgi:nucleoside-diphosphate-sugar epimerase